MRLSEVIVPLALAAIVAVAAVATLSVYSQHRECEKRGLVAVRAVGWGYVCVKEA